MKRETNRLASETSSVPKKGKTSKTVGPFTFEELLAQDARTAKRLREEDEEQDLEPSFVLGYPSIKTIKVSSLGSILKKRFIHPGGE